MTRGPESIILSRAEKMPKTSSGGSSDMTFRTSWPNLEMLSDRPVSDAVNQKCFLSSTNRETRAVFPMRLLPYMAQHLLPELE